MFFMYAIYIKEGCYKFEIHVSVSLSLSVCVLFVLLKRGSQRPSTFEFS